MNEKIQMLNVSNVSIIKELYYFNQYTKFPCGIKVSFFIIDLNLTNLKKCN